MEKTTAIQAIQSMKKNGSKPVDCLRFAINQGFEYPDAEWLVTCALNLNSKKSAAMAEDYLNGE